jgi:bacillithiol system protein YtxJ
MSKSQKTSQNMSFLKNIFGSEETPKSQESKMNWEILTDVNQLGEIIFNSNEKPAVIFKHSTRCSVSRMALKQFENEFDLQDKVTPYFLDLITYREISNEIANRFGVYHESPQILLIKDGQSVYDASHSDIDAGDLKGKL